MYDEYYRQSRQRTCELAGAIGAILLGQRVTGCPKWTVLELIAHQAGMAADFATGAIAGWPTDERTDDQVSSRALATIGELIDEWERHGNAAEDSIREGSGIVLLHDVLCHEADLRGALRLGRPPREAWLTSLGLLLQDFDRRNELGRLVVHTDEGQYEAGTGEPVISLEVRAFELWRGMLGRRSRGQMATWAWLPRAGDYLDVLPVFPPSGVELAEPA